MRILIVGATYMDNFGDMLFAKMILEKFSKSWPDIEKRFYLTSDYCKHFVGSQNLNDFDTKGADALIYMPGGYLGDRSDTSLYTTYLWFKRYFPIGLHYVKKHKPVLILAVDAGPCKYWFMRKIIHRVCKGTTRIIVRNEESKDFLVDRINIYGNNIVVTSDYAQTIIDYPIKEHAAIEEWKSPNKRRILLHINECAEARKVIIPALRQFYLENADKYEIVVASDQHCSNDGETFDEIKRFAGDNAYYYKYGENPLELCSVIKSCDCVITYKLHVGIVAAAYAKSVIPIPQHYKKVQKYYNQIGCGERVLPLKDATIIEVYNRISKYIDEPIMLTEAIYEKAHKNNVYLDDFISKLQGRQTDEK